MHELAGEQTVPVLPEVAVLEQQRHLEGRPLGKAQLALAVVANDPQAGQSRVHGKPRDAHHVVVVPEQRRALVHRIVADRVLARSRDVLRPAVVGRRRQAAVQVHHREARQRHRVRIGDAAAQPRQALHRHAVAVGLRRRDRDQDGQRAV